MGRVELDKSKGSCQAPWETLVEVVSMRHRRTGDIEKQWCREEVLHWEPLFTAAARQPSQVGLQRCCQEVRVSLLRGAQKQYKAGGKMGTCAPIVAKKEKAGANAELWVWQEHHTQRKFPQE